LKHTRNLNLQDSQGRRPLHFAAMSNQKECATLLLRRGVNPAPADLDGRTPLHLAAARGQKALVGLLLSQNGIVCAILHNTLPHVYTKC
jgi:ankyrin repeat protein